LVDTVNFKNLLRDHPDLDEIWISRIIDATQVLPPRDLRDSMANLSELFASTVGEDDVKLFKYHVKFGDIEGDGRPTWNGTIVEIPVSSDIDFNWSRSNLERGIKSGVLAAEQALKYYYGSKEKDKPKDQRSAPVIISAPNSEKVRREKKESPDFRRRVEERLIEAGRLQK
jgi:hypothetical protein